MANWWESDSKWAGAEEAGAAGRGNETSSWEANGIANAASGGDQTATSWQANGTANEASGGDQTTWDTPSKAPAHDFWNMQKWNLENNVLPGKPHHELDGDDDMLFVERLGSSAGLDFKRYETVPVDISGTKANNIPPCDTFEELYQTFQAYIPDALVDNVRRCKYQTPTPVQKYAIPVGLVGRDIMCCAQTGSGKTAAFLFPVIGCMMRHHENPCGAQKTPFEGPAQPDTLIMTPTRELCIQIYEEALKFTHRTPFRAWRLYGGEKTKIQMEELARGADLLVATPGRLDDFINREIIKVDKTCVLVLDEADRMLDMGFQSQIRRIVEENGMPPKDQRQTMMFSATFAEECQRLAQDYLYDYIWIGVGKIGGAVDTVDQKLVRVHTAKKFEKLIEILDTFYDKRSECDKALVFTNTKDTAKWLDEQLFEHKMDTGALHGNLDQHEREQTLTRFRQNKIDVMIATDVAARGLDIEKVALVVNYDMPTEMEVYVHRIGRTGRIGNTGEAITLLATEEADGSCLEKTDNLKRLQEIMSDAKSEVPEWFGGLIASSESNSGWGSWNTSKDVRSGQEGHEAYTAYAQTDAWAGWKKEADDTPETDWKKNDAGNTANSWDDNSNDAGNSKSWNEGKW
eukprot:TRINITY_DN13414_c0_g1_i1.p1 TRINITY_DN13414_c0_g1~~TRINITY_DN13414_c0_g1_i1.p1  ORF type:complete len:631 (-),score=118.19 TRINITY_DN13414_c0_g1_i1:50-1942(-)